MYTKFDQVLKLVLLTMMLLRKSMYTSLHFHQSMLHLRSFWRLIPILPQTMDSSALLSMRRTHQIRSSYGAHVYSLSYKSAQAL